METTTEKLDKKGLIEAARIAESNPDASAFWDEVREQLDAAESAGTPKVERRTPLT